MIAVNTSGGSDSGRSVVFTLGFAIDPNARSVMEQFQRMAAQATPGAIPPGAAPSAAVPSPTWQGQNRITPGGGNYVPPGKTSGTYQQELQRIAEAEKQSFAMVEKFKDDLRKQGLDKDKEMLATLAQMEKDFAVKVAEEKEKAQKVAWEEEVKRQQDLEARRLAGERRWNEIVRQEREKTLVKEGAGYASRLGAGQSASQKRMQNWIGQNGGSDGNFNARSAIESITQLTRGMVLLGVASEENMEKAIRALAKFEAAASIAKGASGLVKQTGALGAGALAVAGVGLAANSVYEMATGKSGGWNDYMGNNYANWDEEYLGGAIYGQTGTKKASAKEKALQASRFTTANKEQYAEDMASGAFNSGAGNRGIMASRDWDNSYQVQRDMGGINRDVNRALRSGNAGDISEAQRIQVARTISGSSYAREGRMASLNSELNTHDATIVATAEASGDPGKINQAYKEREQIARRIQDLEREGYRENIQSLEKIKQMRLEEADQIREAGMSAKERFGQLDEGKRGEIVDNAKRFAAGEDIGIEAENELEQYGSQQVREQLRRNRTRRADASGFGETFGEGFEADAQAREAEAAKIDVEIKGQRNYEIGLKFSDAESARISGIITEAMDVQMKSLIDKALKAYADRNNANDTAKNATQ